MDGPLELQSTRLRLRRLRPDDAAAICAYRTLPAVARFQSWESFGPAEAVRLIADQAAVVPDTPGTWLQLALVAVESESVIGDCGIHFRSETVVEIGSRNTDAQALHIARQRSDVRRNWFVLTERIRWVMPGDHAQQQRGVFDGLSHRARMVHRPR